MQEDHDGMMNPDIDHKLVHYIETRVNNNHHIDDIKKDLHKGHDKKVVAKHVHYVHKHKTKIPHHSKHFEVIFILLGLIVVIVILLALWFAFF